MKNIANELNVSTVTVSKALSNKDGVSEVLRDKIKKKAEEMGYRYNSLAKGMREGLSYNVGVIISEKYFSDNAFYHKLYQCLVIEFAKMSYSCILELISLSSERNLDMPNILANNKVDGLIVLGQLNNDYIDSIAKAKVPYLFLDFYNNNYVDDSIVSDSVYGTYILTNYLIEQGHRRIAFVGEILATSSILDRYLGYYKSLLENGIEFRKDWVIKDRDENGTLMDVELPKDMPDAFVCNCDEVAYLLIEQLKREGYKVPDDVSVVGFDDYIFASLSNPQITTFCISMDTMGEMAADALVRKIKDENYKIGRKVISGDIVIRDSVKTIN